MLATLADLGSRTQAQLCRHLGVDRGPDPDDRRRNIVVATEEGLAALDGFDRIIGYADAALLASLSVEEKAQLVGMLERAVSTMDGRSGLQHTAGEQADQRHADDHPVDAEPVDAVPGDEAQ